MRFFVRIVLFPLIAYFEFDWLRQSLDGFLRAHAVTPPSLSGLIPMLASWPAVVFVANFAILDLADYWRHRLSHRIGWWYGIHSLHHAEEQMTFWSDDRSHVLEDAITYVWLITVGLIIGVPSMQFPFPHSLLPVSRQYVPREHSGRLWMARASTYSSPRNSIAPITRCVPLDGAAATSELLCPWWDILFGTARFHDNTVETGDAGAEPALVNGSWGEQQLAGFRRMIRLARRGRKGAGSQDSIMISVAVRTGRSRVLDQGRLGIPVKDSWKLEAYEQYKARLCAPDYPCFFGQSGEARGEMLYTFIARHGLDELVTNMRQFVSLIGTPPHERSSLIAFFEPDPSITDHMSFVARFWQILQFLHDHDRGSGDRQDTRSSSLGILVLGCEMFVVGASPTYRRPPQQKSRSRHGARLPAQISFHRSDDLAADRGARPATYSQAHAGL